VSARAATIAGVVVVGLLAASGCKKGEGSACKGRESMCLDKTTALTCVSEKLAKVPCSGPLGCTRFEDHANCDVSISSEGAMCLGENEDEYACAPDKKRALLCSKGKIVKVLDCRGKGGCAVAGRALSCDQAVAVAGDVCKTPEANACTADGKQQLRCQNGKFVVYRQCRGKKGCVTDEELTTCDQAQAQEGDACGVQGLVVCALDGQTELVCQGSTFLRSRACKKGCVASEGGRRVACD
jgi:hypothetical protein